MQSKFAINLDLNFSEKSKLIYVENWVWERAFQYLEPCLRLNSITFFTPINILFNNLEDLFGNTHQKEHNIVKF